METYTKEEIDRRFLKYNGFDIRVGGRGYTIFSQVEGHHNNGEAFYRVKSYHRGEDNFIQMMLKAGIAKILRDSKLLNKEVLARRLELLEAIGEKCPACSPGGITNPLVFYKDGEFKQVKDPQDYQDTLEWILAADSITPCCELEEEERQASYRALRLDLPHIYTKIWKDFQVKHSNTINYFMI